MKATTKFLGCLVAVSGLALVGCGDSGGNGGGTDAGTVTGTDAGTGGGDTDGGGTTTVTCPATAPDMGAGMMGACCYRATNQTPADRFAAPEFRLAGIKITQPTTLANAAIRGIVSSALDEERFNWVVQVMGAPAANQSGAVTLRTGAGVRATDGSLSFGTEYPPAMINGMISGENVTTERAMQVFAVPIRDAAGAVIVELPLASIQISEMTLTENRSCVGRRRSRDYDTTSGDLSAFLTVEATKTINVDLLMQDLCTVIAAPGTGNTCNSAAQSTWMVKPDSICTAGGSCMSSVTTPGACDPNSTCNAWELKAEFAAQGSNVTN